MVDVVAYLESHGATRSHGASGVQLTLKCPFCGAGAGRFYVAAERKLRGVDRDGNEKWTEPGDFICFAGKCERRGRFVELFAELEGIDKKAARLELARGVSSGRSHAPPLPPPPPKACPAAKPAPAAEDAAPAAPASEPGPAPRPAPRIAPSGEPMVDTPLPEEFIPCWQDGRGWRVPEYLTGRGLHRETLRKYGIGFCTDGRFRGRIIIPVSCPEGRSFQGRAIDKENKLRYLSGEGCGRLLFGYGEAHKAGTVIVCEGPFDALALAQCGIPALAIMGKRLKGPQASMLARLPARRLVFMLDSDALDDALQQAPMFGTRAVVAGEHGYKDAGDAVQEGGMVDGKAALMGAIRSAIPWEEAKAQRAVQKIQQLRKRLGA